MSTELGLNQIPQHTNFNIRFANITRDGSGFPFNTVGAWIFAMHNSLSGTPTILKSSTGVASGDFSIDSVGKNVTVAVRPSEFSYGQGEYFVALTASTSGVRNSHLSKTIHIVPQISTTGV